MTAFEVISRETRCLVGEGPLWHVVEQALYWVDIVQPSLYRLHVNSGALDRWTFDEMIGFVAMRQSEPGFIAGFRSGFATITFDPLTVTPIVDPEPDRPNSRLNDGKVDPCGRLWAGTMAIDGTGAAGTLYRLGRDGVCTAMDPGYDVPNGPAFSPDGRFMYHADTVRGIVHRFHVSDKGDIFDREDLIRFPSDWGLPDGITVDAEGALWIGHWDGARISRFDPDGRLMRSVSLPASRITCCAFGGDDLDRLFVTSAAIDRHAEALAGVVFEIDPGVRGLASIGYAG